MEKIQNFGVKEKIIDKMKAGESISLGWDYLKNLFKPSESDSLAQEISKSIFRAYENQAFILPKSEDEILQAITEDRLIAIIGYDKSMQKKFIAAASYNILGTMDGVQLIEVGALISNQNVTTRKDFAGLKDLVYPINDGGAWKNGQSYGALVLDAVIAKIKANHSNFQIIATTRSEKSQKALLNAGFSVTNWSPDLQKHSCDPSCKGVENHRNCQFAEGSFTQLENSGCQLMQY
jgi:hypothetical protein